jgi:hypothetical protein
MQPNELITAIENRLSADYTALEAKTKKWRSEQNGTLQSWQTNVIKNGLKHINEVRELIKAFYVTENERYTAIIEVNETAEKYNDLRFYCEQNGYKVTGLKSTLWIDKQLKKIKEPELMGSLIHKTINHFQLQARNDDRPL